MTRVSAWVARASRVLLVLGCCATLLMMAHVAIDVVAKLLFGKPIVGTLEMVTHYYMVAVVFLPLAMVQARRAQITVEVFTHKLPPRVTAALDGVVGFAGFAFLGVLAWMSGAEALSQTQLREEALSSHFPIEIWPARWLVVVGAALVALNMLAQAIADVLFAVAGKPTAFDEHRGTTTRDTDSLIEHEVI